MITEILIIILIVVIIILFTKLIEFENFNPQIEDINIKSVGLDKESNLPDLDNNAPKEEDKINKLIIKDNKINNEINNNEIKTELNQDSNIKLSPKNDKDFSYNTTKHDINNMINNLNKEEKEKENVEVKHKKELDDLKDINPNKDKENEENDIIKSNLTYSTKEIDSEMNKRYENQPEEYKQSFNDNRNTGFIYKDNVITDENIYTFNGFNYMSAHQLFIPTNYKTKPEDYGRNYIPPELWYKNNQRLNLPVCVPVNGRCLVQDVPTTGYPIDYVEWHTSRKIMNPDGINTKYIREKLNTNHDY